MTDRDDTMQPAPMERVPEVAGRPPVHQRIWLWGRANLFNTWYNSILTLLILWALYLILPPVLDWLVFSATWGEATPDECRVEGAGACWAFVHEKYRLILFGTYEFDQQWRPALSIALFVGIAAATCYKAFWRREIVYAWVVVLAACWILMGGASWLGLEVVKTSDWGGLALTLMLAGVGFLVAFPLSVCLALGRRSNLPIVKSLCVCFIELIRGVPLITLLFMSSVMFPLFLPDGVTFDKLLRAQVAIIMFLAAYLAEVIRGGLQAIPKGQYEAADALGLGYWQKTILIILPQALRITIPPMVNTFIGVFKDTSLVVIIGLFDLMLATRAALTDAPWRPFFVEAYVFTAAVYWVFCYAMSKYSLWLERDLRRSHDR